MKAQFILALSFVMIFASVQAQDIRYAMRNVAVMDRGIKCILEEGPCDGIGSQIKKLLPEAINNRCQRCNIRQQVNSMKLMKFMATTYPNEWQAVLDHYTKKN